MFPALPWPCRLLPASPNRLNWGGLWKKSKWVLQQLIHQVVLSCHSAINRVKLKFWQCFHVIPMKSSNHYLAFNSFSCSLSLRIWRLVWTIWGAFTCSSRRGSRPLPTLWWPLTACPTTWTWSLPWKRYHPVNTAACEIRCWGPPMSDFWLSIPPSSPNTGAGHPAGELHLQ